MREQIDVGLFVESLIVFQNGVAPIGCDRVIKKDTPDWSDGD
mgnify:CR=1 FL=1